MYPHPDDPLEKAYHRLTRHTLKCPLTTSSTTIFNMVSIRPITEIMLLLLIKLNCWFYLKSIFAICTTGIGRPFAEDSCTRRINRGKFSQMSECDLFLNRNGK